MHHIVIRDSVLMSTEQSISLFNMTAECCTFTPQSLCINTWNPTVLKVSLRASAPASVSDCEEDTLFMMTALPSRGKFSR